MSTWPLRDIMFVAMLIFNAGGVIWTIRYIFKTNAEQFKRIDEDLKIIFARMADLEKGQARIEGKIEGRIK